MTTSRSRLVGLLAVALACAVLVACSDDDLTDGAGSDATDAAVDDTAAPSPDTTTTVEEPPSGTEFADLPHACDLVPHEEVDQIIGPYEEDSLTDRALDRARYTQCLWEAVEGVSLIAVSVVDTPRRFELHQQVFPDQQPVADLGDEALVAPGVSSETRGATGGYTVSIRVGDISVVVALRYDGVTPADHAVELARGVVARLG